MSKSYDIIIIGGGHNGLTAAATLAQKNKQVLVLEKRAVLGGIAAGEEFHPGYYSVGLLHDTSTLRSEVVQELDLSSQGLTCTGERAPIKLLAKDGRSVVLYADTEKTCAEIAKVSSKDAEAYREYQAFIGEIRSFIQSLLNEIPPDMIDLGLKELWALAKKGIALKRLGEKTMMELLKVAPMSVEDFLDEKFETDFLKAGLAGPVIYGSTTSPRSAYTTLNLLIWECTACEQVEGGPAALINALEGAARKAGVEIQTNAEVEKILLEGGKVSGVRTKGGEEFHASCVASSCSPKLTFLDLFAPNELDYSLEHEIQLYRTRGTTAKIHLALAKVPNFPLDDQVSFARTGNSFLEMERSFDHSKYREFSEEPILDMHLSPASDPDGLGVLSVLVHYAPYELEQGWNKKSREKLLDVVLKTLARYIPDIAKGVLASEVLTPLELEERYSLPEGHIFHGEHAVDQILTRPIPACARYETPVSGLFLCGSGSHPGGGITAMPGYLAAKLMLKSL